MSSSVRPQDNHYTSAGADVVCFPVDEQQGHEAEGQNKDDDRHGDEDSGEVQGSRAATQPRLPSERERREHDASHCPYRSWCEHCVRGQGCEYGHSSVAGVNVSEEVARVILDYCYLTERATEVSNDDDAREESAAGSILTTLVMKETLCGSVWAYVMESKSYGENPWIVDQIVDDA